MMHSTYSVETRVRNSVRFVCVTDRDEGMSVTNDIEHVVDALHASGMLNSGDRFIYRDTMGVWDEAVIDSACRFVDFRSLGATSCTDAISLALNQ
ncbi:hypothetical protein [Paraburkholderia sp. HD33-4]|uniref:hypothetical protein n=1 Tax=Paraburkholderia sp. HD33-4 TaxID=2883242 RepID=UPI001F312B7A|nr:hypothetical protein [Paraburkholderia sp. HD33-4]